MDCDAAPGNDKVAGMARLTLTFDNGPTPGVTEQVLAALAARGLPATFFVVGDRLKQPGARELAAQAKAAGHWIGNHTMSHSTPLGRRAEPDHPQAEIAAVDALLGELAEPQRLFRPNAGGGVLGPHVLSRAAVDHLTAHRHTVVLWNCVPRDWEDPAGWAARALAEIERRDWTLLVLHDLPTGAMDRLPGFLDEARRRGVEIVQDFPADCVPIRRGEIAGALHGLMS